MNVISLKDYAKNNNVSYEAVRQQVVRYKNELSGHVIKDGRQQFLDEEAVAFLDNKRQKNPVVIFQQDKDDRIENLENENKRLLLKITDLQDKLFVVQEEKMALKEERLALADKIAKVELLEERKLEAELALEETREREKNVIQEKEALQRENDILISKKLDVELKLEELKEDVETAEDIAKANEQEAARAKSEVEKLTAEFNALKLELENVSRLSFFKFRKYRKAKKKESKK